ncbi:RNI-like protein [Aspergillus avenaceus]|uniref:RNI-like protein n=1 Tax=Aspergillus avenaceus TaxID=36643 RepID=A0A5N6TDT6_ASPAV|nr:RNI-like protein [Aspergillus avenaceus]
MCMISVDVVLSINMSPRENRRQTRNQIRGPHSALTDFLAANNISAAQIRDDHQRRLRDAERQTTGEVLPSQSEDGSRESPGDSSEQSKKRRRNEATTLAKIKQSKEFARRKARRTDPKNDDDLIAREMMCERSRPVPGQLDNCEICSKRFTVTPYSKTGYNGGLLCTRCSKSMKDDAKMAQAKKQGARISRRQNQSNLLDGVAQQGALSLVEMCIKKVADNINDIEEFGDLPSQLLRRLSQILSKRRALDPRTLNLFLRPELDTIDIYDSAKLETHDFQKIFTSMPALVNVNLRFAGQIKDSVFEYMLGRELKIKRLQLDATNLVSDSYWRRLFKILGPQLEILKLSNLDFSLNDETVKVMCGCCTTLRRLKLNQCWKIGDDSLQALSSLNSLEHLSLDLTRETKNESILEVVSSIGPRLRTLSLEGFPNADDELLQVIHHSCDSLRKLRLSNNSVCTDKGFRRLFTGWSNPSLEFVDFSSMRDLDNSDLDSPEGVIGLASEGFVSLMEHSGTTIRKLNISSCRHISRDAFEHVFSGGKIYPNLRELDISFHTVMDDYLIGKILQCCPAIKKLVAFACFNVRDVRIPAGVALIGGLKAQGTIVFEGTS